MRNFEKVFPFIAGVIVVLLGISVIFDLGFPIFRIIIGALFIYWGVTLITRRSRKRRYEYKDEKINVTGNNYEKEYSLVFGKAKYDLADIVPTQGESVVKLNIAFGAAVVKINKKAPVKVFVNTAFGSAKTPDGNLISFGRHEYTTASYNPDKKFVLVDIDLAFGSVVVE